MKKRRNLQVMDEMVLKRTALILGESSAAAKAIVERDRRRAAGEDVICVLDPNSNSILVGPDPRG
jgi:hypothetical protein